MSVWCFRLWCTMIEMQLLSCMKIFDSFQQSDNDRSQGQIAAECYAKPPECPILLAGLLKLSLMGERQNLTVLMNQHVGDCNQSDTVTAKADFRPWQRSVKPQLPLRATDVGGQTWSLCLSWLSSVKICMFEDSFMRSNWIFTLMLY